MLMIEYTPFGQRKGSQSVSFVNASQITRIVTDEQGQTLIFVNGERGPVRSDTDARELVRRISVAGSGL